jgi:hypothetical protein
MKKVTFVIFALIIFFNGYSTKKVYSKANNLLKNNTDLQYRDFIYNPDIKTVNLYSDKNIRSKIEPPAINITSPNKLILEFDELYQDARYFQAKIIHCTWDWQPSDIRSIEYLSAYNEFDIQEYEYSVYSRIPYTHYTFVLPKVELPGNYLLVVYDRDNPDELAFSKRFMIYDQIINIAFSYGESMGVQEKRTHQQIDFILNYNKIDLFNPQRDIKVVVRQNQSWVTAIYNLKATQIDEFKKELEYRPFNLENNFFGGNEFRFFDLNSVIAPGRNVDRVFIKEDRVDAFLLQDKIREKEFYSIWDDLNGGFIISNIDGQDPRLESDYVNVHFFLQSPQKLNSDIYIFGKLSNYDLLPEFKMKYDGELKGYRADALLKQGWYDYIYYTPDDLYSVEGSHFETENDYEILVYIKPQGRTYDILAGYVSFNTGRRN